MKGNTIMPVATELSIAAKDVKKGDQVAGYVIADVDRKDKYTYLITASGRKQRHEHDATVLVVRDVPTEAEQAEADAIKKAARKADIEADIFWSIERSKTNLEKAVAEVQKAAAWNIDSQWSPIRSYLDAIAKRDIWAKVENAVSRTFGEYHDRAGQTITLVDAVLETAKEMREGLLSNRWRGSSTSDVSNAAERTMAAAASDWLRSFGVISILHDAEQ